MAETPTLEIREMRLGDLQPAARNPKQHDVGAIASSMRRFGMTAPPALNETTGRLVFGHGRIETLLALKRQGGPPPARVRVAEDGEWLVPVIRGLAFATDAEAEAYLVADNQITALGGWQEDALATVLQEILATDAGLEGVGFDAEDLEDLLERLTTQSGESRAPKARYADAMALVDKWGVRAGDLWEIPSHTTPRRAHRLLVGTALEAASYHRLLGAERADCVFTDPPYGVDYQAALGAEARVEADDLSGRDLARYLAPAFTAMAQGTRDDGAFYVWHASRTRRAFEQALEAAGLVEKQYLIWAKDGFVLGHADYHYQHEPCFYAHKAGWQPRFFGDRSQATVWRLRRLADSDAPGEIHIALANGVQVDDGETAGVVVLPRVSKDKGKRLRRIALALGERLVLDSGHDGRTDLWDVARDPASTYAHPTQKPTDLALRALRNSTQPGESVLDPFLGSGATVVAAEQIGRQGRGMDLDPRYIAVTLERLAEMGLTPRRLEPA